MEEAYTKLSELFYTGSTLADALELIGLKKTKFYSKQYIVELSVVNKEEYERLLSQDQPLLTMNKVGKQTTEGF